ncbi:MAG TPA: hypothetical protein DCS93_10640 [Microscillaceae bacterium]|nr:hypothetical protein [Microscillaceae bacterium]
MKKRLINLFFLLLGIVLLWLAFQGQNLSLIIEELQKVDYRWGVLVLLASVGGHLSRALRWKLLLIPLQKESKNTTNEVLKPISLWNVWWAMMFGYLVNLGIPRLGEVSRCVAVQRSEKLHFESVLGTVVAERAIDLCCLFLLVLFTFFYQYEIAATFFRENIFAPFQQLLGAKKWMLYGLIMLGILGLLVLWLLWKKNWFARLRQFITRILAGLISIYHMPHKWRFLAHTFLIWFSYFLMTYWWFFAIPATQHLGFQAGLFLLVVGSIGKSVPIQGGGMGAYHFLVTKGLSLPPFLIAATPALTLATVIHLAQTVFYLLVGGIAAIVVLYKNREVMKNNGDSFTFK